MTPVRPVEPISPASPRSPGARLMRLLVPTFSALLLFAVLLPQAAAAGSDTKSIAVQVRVAEEMTDCEDWDEAIRRWIQILYYFGPSDQEARALYQIGALALRHGRSDVAVSRWQEAALRYPEEEWGVRARESLELLGKQVPEKAAEEPQPYLLPETKPDQRQFNIAQGDFSVGHYVFAIRDWIKIPSLFPDSPLAPLARFRVGTCQVLLGQPERAIEQWRQVVQEHPDSPDARNARAGIVAWEAVLNTIGLYASAPSLPDLDTEWQPFRGNRTQPDRGLSYAEDLFENGIVVYALQEYAKVLCDLYTPRGGENLHKPYARYRMGVCAYRLGDHNAASRQWRCLLADWPDSPWADRASRALTAVGVTDAFSSDAGTPSPELPPAMPSGLVKRFHLAGQLVDCGLPLVASKEYLKVMYVLTAGRPNPLQAEAAFRLGLCQHLRGRPDLAVAAWQRAIKDYPETPWAEEAQTAIANARARESALNQVFSPPEESPS